MCRTCYRKIYRDITARKTRTALVALSIFVGVLGVVVLTTLGQLVSRQLEKDLAPAEMAMLRTFVNTPLRSPVDNAAALKILRGQPEQPTVEGQAVYEFHWRQPADPDFQTGHLYAYSEPFSQIRLEPIRLVRGVWPVEGRGEIAIERRMADRRHLSIGDSLVVQINGGGTETLRIVGIVFQPYLYPGGDDGSASAYAAYADAQRIVGFAGFSSIYVRYDNFRTARNQSYAFRKAIQNQTPYTIIFYLVSNPDDNIYLVGVRQSARVLLILGVVALVVASFLVTTVIVTIVAEQRQQIGALKALGASRGNILTIYLGIVAVYGLLGTIPAVLVGIPLGQQAAKAAAPLANTVIEDLSPPLGVPLLGILMGLGVPLLAAILPAANATRVTILDAITDQGITTTYGKGLLPRLVRRLRLPMRLLQAINNVFRHKARLMLIYLTLTLSAAAFMGVFAIFYTLNGVVGEIQTTLNFQVSVDPGSIDVMDLMQTLLTEEQVREIQPGVAVQLHAEPVPPEPDDPDALPGDGAALYVTGIDPAADLGKLVLVAGDAWSGDPARAGIVITLHMAEKFQKTVGDTLRLVAPAGAPAGAPPETVDFEIIGIAEFPLETAFMDWRALAAFVGAIRDAPTPNAYWERLDVHNGDNPFAESGVWAVGIDERIGALLAPGFNPDQPGVIISRTLADAGGFEQGGSITLQPPDGSSLLGALADPGAVTYPILAVIDIKPQELSVVARALPPEVVQVDKPPLVAMYWADLASLVNLDYNALSPEMFYINLDNPQANGLNSTYVPPRPVFENQGTFEQRIAQTILSLGLIMGMASSLMAVVGAIGLLTITSIGVLERQREIGVMRSVGASSWIVMRQFLLEGLLIGVAAWGVGLPLSYALSRILIDAVPFSSVIVFHYTPRAAALGLVGMLVVTGAATLYPSLAASRKTVSEILRYQ